MEPFSKPLFNAQLEDVVGGQGSLLVYVCRYDVKIAVDSGLESWKYWKTLRKVPVLYTMEIAIVTRMVEEDLHHDCL